HLTPLHSFPTRRSSDLVSVFLVLHFLWSVPLRILFRPRFLQAVGGFVPSADWMRICMVRGAKRERHCVSFNVGRVQVDMIGFRLDRKSTRLNSSHSQSS